MDGARGTKISAKRSDGVMHSVFCHLEDELCRDAAVYDRWP